MMKSDRIIFKRYRLHLPSTVLDPLQVDVAEAGARHPLQAVHVVFIDLHTKDLRVALNVVPLSVGLQRLLDAGVLEPRGQFGRVDHVVDNTLRGDGGGTGGREGRRGTESGARRGIIRQKQNATHEEGRGGRNVHGCVL